MSMVYQEPGRALNPSLRVGRQIAEVFRDRRPVRATTAMHSAEEMLRKVQISDPGRVMRRYPHELSGGMAQRAVIAMALAVSPSLLILDEPTTALDATVEAEVLDLVAALRQEFDTSVLFISHNLAVIAKMCDRVGVLYAGELVEEGPARAVFDEPPAPVHGRAAALHPAARAAQGRRPAGHHPRLPAARPVTRMTGCIFAPRCALAADRCREADPPFFDVGELRTSRCFFHEQAPDLPRATPASVAALLGDSGDRRPAGGRRGAVQDLRGRRCRRWPGWTCRSAARRDARAGGRVGQRQDHAGPRPARADRAGPGLGRHPARQAAQPGRAAAAAGRCCARCRWCSRIRTRLSTAVIACGA